MENLADSLNKAYQDFISAAAVMLEAKARADGNKTADVDTALENVKEKWELFKVACDKAEEFVQSAKKRIGSECQVNEAKGPVAGRSGEAANTGVASVSALPLEQMSESVRWLVQELQNGAGSSSAANAANSQQSGPFDAKFPEDGAQ
ncbi:hypothetical protein RIF29_32262 [Crotalaria pallida]|uniref:Mediator of RNA polymerase II transcription subunit 32 n=1 Tax=Crotalaria pallida TaxID=3830 RepID=A0AAN9EK91_CROPI